MSAYHRARCCDGQDATSAQISLASVVLLDAVTPSTATRAGWSATRHRRPAPAAERWQARSASRATTAARSGVIGYRPAGIDEGYAMAVGG